MAKNRESLIESIRAFYERGIEIVKKKNDDYATGEDPFKNFRFASLVGVEPKRAILVRVADKLARVSNLLEKEASVKDERIEDTLLDIANYIAILHAMLEHENN